MNDARDEVPSVDQLHGVDDAALNELRRALGDEQIEVATTGELAVLLSRLPADTPIAVASHLRIDPELDEGSTESRTAVVATTGIAFTSTPTTAVDAHGDRDVHARVTASLILGAVLVGENRPAPVDSRAYEPGDRVVEAMYNGDGGAMMAALRELVLEVAGRLDGDTDASLPEWIADQDLVRDLDVEASRLRHSASRLQGLQARVIADLDAQDSAERRGDSGA